MKTRITLWGLWIALFTVACGDVASQQIVPKIDMNAEYSEKKVFLQDIADVSYIPLETTDEMLFDASGMIAEMSGEGIVGVDVWFNKLCFFTADGKAVRTLERKGQGPEEYLHLDNALVDRECGEVYVVDRTRKTLHVYALDGTYRRTLKFDTSSLRLNDLAIYNKDYLISFRDYPVAKGLNKQVTPYCPAVLVSKKDGVIVDSLPLQKDYVASITIGRVVSGEYRAPRAFHRSGHSLYLSDIGSDTIYSIDTKRSVLRPLLMREPSVRQDEDGKFFLHLRGVTSRYAILHRQAKKITMGANFQMKDEDSHFLLYDRKTGDICTPRFVNREWDSSEAMPMIEITAGNEDCGYVKLEPFRLIEALEAGELSGKLKDIAQGLKEDDNPVLMVVKFKK